MAALIAAPLPARPLPDRVRGPRGVPAWTGPCAVCADRAVRRDAAHTTCSRWSRNHGPVSVASGREDLGPWSSACSPSRSGAASRSDGVCWRAGGCRRQPHIGDDDGGPLRAAVATSWSYRHGRRDHKRSFGRGQCSAPAPDVADGLQRQRHEPRPTAATDRGGAEPREQVHGLRAGTRGAPAVCVPRTRYRQHRGWTHLLTDCWCRARESVVDAGVCVGRPNWHQAFR